MQIFIKSVYAGFMIGIGGMMYLAIDNYNRSRNIVFIILPVMIFILSGFEHSIANMFYFNLAGAYSGKAFGCLAVMAAGNGVGAKVFDRLCPRHNND